MSEPPALTVRVAEGYARAGLANIGREYPNQPAHLLTGPEDLLPPSALHPIFFGSYDWHSSVHQHWMLVRLLRIHSDLEVAATVRAALDERVTDEAARVEARYLEDPNRRSFERPYGWAWLLTLAAELTAWGDAGAARWEAALRPLTTTVRERCLTWLRDTPYPQRSGTHGNSAFAAGLLHDAAVATRDEELRDAVAAAAQRWYGDDGAYPGWLEPSATDFLSPALVEIDLMRRIRGDDLAAWVEGFLPDPGPLTTPVQVADRSDPHGVHLDGLNLCRAWCWHGLADALPTGHALRPLATTAATAHAEAALPWVLTGEYVGEHWLASFAVYLLGGGAITPPNVRSP